MAVLGRLGLALAAVLALPVAAGPEGVTYSRDIAPLRAAERRKMPPWPPVPGHGDFVGERRLADAEIARLRAWLAAGAPEGDPRDLPSPRIFPTLWSAGEPD